MKTIKELLAGEDLWQALKTAGSFPFIDDSTNRLFLVKYGRLPVFCELESDTVETLTPLIVSLYAERWGEVMEAQGVDMAAAKVRTILETTNRTQDTTNDEGTTQKVSAYNSDTLIDDSGSDRNGSENMTGEVTRDLKEAETSLSDAYQNLMYSEKVRILNVAMQDVADFIKPQIF